VGLAILMVLAAAFMLIRGDPKWIYPVIAGALALFLIPIATQLIVAAFTPKGAPVPPLFEWRQGLFPYPYPAGSLGAELERNYAAIHRTYEALLAAQQASLTALFAVAYTETFIAVASSFTPVGAAIQASKFVAYLAQIGDPLLQIALTTFNAATAGVMIFHFLDLMARLAVRMAAPLLALALLAMIFKPTRALGGALYFFALAMIVSSYIGYYLSPTAEAFTAWAFQTSTWLNATAANATGTAPVPLLFVGGTPNTLYLATYNNSFATPSPAEIAAKINETLGPYNLTVPEGAVAGAVDLARQYGFFEKAAFNGTDWVAATAGSITPIAYGNKTWNATAVLDWLDFPAPAPEEGGCVSYGDFRELLDYLLPPQEAQREKAWVANLSSAICRFHRWLGFASYFVDVRPPEFWRLLSVSIDYTALGERNAVVGRGTARAWDGVWGWLPGSGPDNETCLNALGNESSCALLDTTIRAGLYNFSLWNLRGIGAKAAVDPVVGGVADYFNFSLPKASLYLNKTIPLYTWTEVCTWTQGNKTYTSSRQWWDAYSAQKVDEQILYNVSTTIYGRPWVVKEPRNYTAQIPVVERRWVISVWSEHGPWDGPTPPKNATCTVEDRHVYKTIYVYDVAPRTRILYGFWWMQGGLIYVEPRGSALPGVLWDNSTSAAYVEGAESQFYCSALTAPASTPEAASAFPSSPIAGVRDALDRLTSQDYLELIVVRNVSLAYLNRSGFFGLAQAAGRINSSLVRAAVESGEEYLAFINESPAALPMYYAVPLSYQAENFLVACAMYDWRGSTVVNGSLELAPGREWWVASYPMGDSRVAEAVVAAKADMFRYVFGMPPPPPPANLSGFVKQWRIPWNNRTLPYKPYYGPGMRMPPRDNSTGIPLWSIQNLEDVQITQGNIVGWLFTVLFVTILSIAAVFEFLGALLDFPTPAREVWGFVTGVIQDWTYWLPIRVAVRGKLFTRIWRAVKRPVMRQTVRTAARVHSFFASRVPALRYIRSPDLKEYYREYVKRRRDIAVKDPAEQIREEINVKWRREALERVLRAMEERADVEWMRNLERRREEERRRMLEAARRIWNAIKADNMVEVLRELSPRFDMWLQERVEMSRGSLSYHLFWWRLDRLPFMWRSLLRLDPHVIARLEAEGRIKPEEAEALRNLRAAVEAYAAELRWGWARLHSVPQYVKAAEEEFEKARQRMAQEAEKGLEDFRRFIADFERRYEALRRYFSGDEGERAKAAGEAKKAVERLEEALRHFAVIDKAPRARLVSALNEALRHIAEGRAPQIPRDASVEDIVKGLALMDLGLAVKALRSAERYLEAHYAVAPTRYDTRQIAAEIVRWHIEERIPTLKLAGLARGVVLGARSIEEGEIALRSWSGRTAARRVEDAPWEAVAHRASLMREQRLGAAEAVRIKPDVVLLSDYARYLAGFRVEGEALDALRKAVEYRRIARMLERAEELRMPPTAVERLAAEAERLRQEVLRETSQIYRRFGEEFFFVKDLLEGHRVVRREVPEVRSVVRAFEEALAEALKAPERRERAFREAFMERVERLAEERARRGDAEGAERVRRAAAELAKASESVGWRAVEDVSVVLPAVAKAFEEAYSEAKSPSELARAFRARAEEAARRFEQGGMGDVAARIRRAAERIAGEVGDRASVERMRALLSPERAGRAIEGLELLYRLLSDRAALDAYRNRSGEAGKAAEELDKARRVAEELGLSKVLKALEKPDGKRAAKALGELERELARLYGALELAEYVRRPRADAEFGHAWAVARILGLEEADRLFRALSEVSLFLLREGREIFRNPLYDEVKHLIDEERARALVRAPLYSYVVDRLGPDVLRPTYARWYGLFADYGPYLSTAFEHARTSAAKAGAPLGLTGGFSYARKMMGWLGDFSREAVMRGLKAYYRGEGRPFRELAEMTIRGAKVQLYEKAAELARARSDHLLSESKAAGGEAAEGLRAEAEGLRLLASVLRAKAAYEEIRLVQTYLRGAERRAEALLREAASAWGVEAQLELSRRAREGLEAARKKAERHLADARARY
ncbi:MAG: hypothetical protein RRB51_11575, partial [Thermoproteus sp.]|nr:hypothetical protein [Thermoproteus sp.]